jgi:hypothetical protein
VRAGRADYKVTLMRRRYPTVASEREWGLLDPPAQQGVPESAVEFAQPIDIDVVVVDPDQLLHRLMAMRAHCQK